jgi:uncharacterized membrane protein YphA (DoxX/SURF4 family)
MEPNEHRVRRAPSKPRTFAIWTLRIVLGIVFAWIATTKLTGTGITIQWFAAIGWGQWFRYATGAVDFVGVVLLFFRRTTFFGALALAGSVGLGTMISLTVLRGNTTWGGPIMVAVPLVLTLLAATLAWLTRPSRVN